MLEAHSLAAQRGETTLFAGLSFSVRPGSATVVTGANGSGKTTLLRIVAGLARAQSGSFRWRSRPVRNSDPTLRDACLYVGHAAALKDELSADENLQLHASLQHAPASFSEVSRALDAVNLRAVASIPVRFLSQGQRRRIGLARLRLSRRPLWLLDEPTDALDAAGVALLEDMLRQHLAGDGMALIATHQPIALAPAAVNRLAL